jgi:AraC family transcriptional regulator of adaptative response/methylated-DNA-[protein]-cysteine methyltransferase
MGAAPKRAHKTLILLKSAWIDTALGLMLVIADDHQLYLLEFVEKRGIEKEIEKLHDRLPASIVPGKTKSIESIEKELKHYFAGKLKQFKTPFILIGTDFQKNVWNALCDIRYGQTKSYAEQAQIINKPTAYRAVANANGMNQLAIIVPCHRIIRSHGELGGYGGGVARKQWLLDHEKKYTRV